MAALSQISFALLPPWGSPGENSGYFSQSPLPLDFKIHLKNRYSHREMPALRRGCWLRKYGLGGWSQYHATIGLAPEPSDVAPGAAGPHYSEGQKPQVKRLFPTLWIQQMNSLLSICK